MLRLPDLSVELKSLASAILIFAGLSVLMGFGYILAAHREADQSFGIHPAQIAALYTGPGVSTVTLISLAHIHLLGLLPIFAIIGFIFVHSTLPKLVKIGLSLLPFVAFLIDVTSWFLIKDVDIRFVYVTISAGATFISCLGLMVVIGLYDLWLGRRSA
jgi:hypothetical protein